MAKIPIRIITDSNDRNPSGGLIDRRFGMSADWVTADSSSAGGVLPISLAEFQAASANFMLATAGEAPAAWYQFNNGITVTGSGVSQWNDQSGNGRHLLQGTDANRPAKQASGIIRFNGTTHSLKANDFTLNQPETVYILCSQVTWADGQFILDGGGLGSNGSIYQSTASPQIRAYAGTNLGLNSDLAIGVFGALCAVFNGASSSYQVNNGTPTTGNAGALNMGGLTIGADGSRLQFGEIDVKEVIVFPSAHSLATRTKIINYLRSL